ncbi:MAG: RNA-splicing ligase RtcB [Candidatus Aenigmatarchaeota archaeon]|nr:MAG: RNA-splicing ligase RtcB [Candidatus Aenigmarchaeota archaeon]
MKEKLRQIRECVWELPKEGKMKVPAWLFLSEKLLQQVEEGAVQQIANVACLPGIYKHSIALPDMHFGYGFPIGGVAALDAKEGGLSPGGIGFDINCGVRLLRTNLRVEDVKPKIQQLVEQIFRNVPSGVGRGGKVKLTAGQTRDVLEMGARWAVENGYGYEKDLEHLEERGCMRQADASKVSEKAVKRGMPQLGSLGAGNHFLEVQQVTEIYQPEIAKVFGIQEVGQICVMIHTGSRGLGHQICTDYLNLLESRFRDLLKTLPDRELVFAPAGTQECEDYFKAMCCGANFAWANRQMITHWVRQAIISVLKMPEEDIGLEIVYDVAHNIGKLEKHKINGEVKEVFVHRKGGTRCFGPGNPDIPKDYQAVGQPVLVPGDMGSASYVLVGTERAEEESFSSVCHGAGRVLSRHAALKKYRGEKVKQELAGRGISVRSASWGVLAEEAPGVYKDIHEVVRVCEAAGLSKTVAKLVPLGVVKG